MPIELMTAHFVRSGSTATLDQAEFRTPGGRATMTGQVTGLGAPGGSRHTLKLAWNLEDASSWASRVLPIPGWFTGGVFTGKATVTGTAANVAQSAQGSFDIRDAGFLPPQRFLGGPSRPVGVRWARGLFDRTNGKLELSKLDLNTTVGTATGRVVADDRWIATIRAKGVIDHLEPLVDLWPSLADKVQGGHGDLTVALHGPLRQPTALAGTVDLHGKDTTLNIAGVDPKFGTQPFEELGIHMVLPGNGAVRLATVRVRGPKVNMDGDGIVTASGKLSAKGKAWLTSRYTKQLFKPKFLYPVASAVGLGRIKTDFEIHGTAQEARLDLGITDSLLWKLGIKSKVPEDLRKLATGQVPLWSTDGPPAKPTTRVAGAK